VSLEIKFRRMNVISQGRTMEEAGRTEGAEIVIQKYLAA
jgi:hypothetical protein